MPSWQDIASEAQKHRDDTIAIVDDSLTLSLPAAAHNVIAIPRQILSREEARITELPVSTLVQNLAAGTLTSVTVVKAFLRRAAIAQKLVGQQCFEAKDSIQMIVRNRSTVFLNSCLNELLLAPANSTSISGDTRSLSGLFMAFLSAAKLSYLSKGLGMEEALHPHIAKSVQMMQKSSEF